MSGSGADHEFRVPGTRFDAQDSGLKAALAGKTLDWLREQIGATK